MKIEEKKHLKIFRFYPWYDLILFSCQPVTAIGYRMQGGWCALVRPSTSNRSLLFDSSYKGHIYFNSYFISSKKPWFHNHRRLDRKTIVTIECAPIIIILLLAFFEKICLRLWVWRLETCLSGLPPLQLATRWSLFKPNLRQDLSSLQYRKPYSQLILPNSLCCCLLSDTDMKNNGFRDLLGVEKVREC